MNYMMTEDAKFLLKMKQAKVKDEIIATKLGMTVDAMNDWFNRIMCQAISAPFNGYQDLVASFNVLAMHYQSLGEALKMVAAAIGNEASVDQVLKAAKIPVSEASTVERICLTHIVLNKFEAVTAQEMADAVTKDFQQGASNN